MSLGLLLTDFFQDVYMETLANKLNMRVSVN
jgi:hypothetical protein